MIDVARLPDKTCKGCKWYKPTSIFDLCHHKSSQYSIEGKFDFHTIAHMRTFGCGEDGRLAEGP